MTVSRFSILTFVALVLTAITLIPLGAHVFEMSAKMKLGRDAYFVVQGLYRGWAYFGIAMVGSLLASLANAALPGDRRDRFLSLFARAHDRRLARHLFGLRLSGEPDHAELDLDPGQLEELALPVGVGAHRVGGLRLHRIPGLGLAGGHKKGEMSGGAPLPRPRFNAGAFQ
jgi:hypothetical protein